MLVLIFFPGKPKNDAQKCDSPANDPACLCSPFVDPVEENEIHIKEMKGDREEANDEDANAKKAHDNRFLF